jgi:hypothetical protein
MPRIPLVSSAKEFYAELASLAKVDQFRRSRKQSKSLSGSIAVRYWITRVEASDQVGVEQAMKEMLAGLAPYR